ncbi:MAG: CRISPR-associated helicase Cas3 [Thermotoga sp. 50_1627]|uniref:CRISPR-associated helicase Cas3' n=1 Tax=Pseudothermotoga sp. TaxID=2033661 RepID=UPI00076DB227|nr:MAG: CRISPR-associated helicase Cas3 [Thermotoga sp. 50_64]KUK24438.1 MAG: CRISPR-associated helicase Cas3 [Thermotoga sp. 50_1627]MBC7117236.1 CRISPR-associated helicase Cas3' [Pseudothermotoga sp.]HBT39538.1 hypothetical protein [Pseudothermotoga sp.]HCO98534.1 hypothetical protein [Pseudothermotoga sp.]
MLDRLKSHPDRLLLNHLVGTTQRASKKAEEIYWEPFGISREKALKLVRICSMCHDFAKAAEEFQDYIIHPERGHVTHAPLSSLVTYHVLLNNGFDHKLAAFGYFVVRHHHDRLTNFGFMDENLSKLEKQFQSIPKDFVEWLEDQTDSRLSHIDVKDIWQKAKVQISKLNFFADFTLKDYILLHTLASIVTSSDREDAALKDMVIEIEPKITIDLIENYVAKIPKDSQIYPLRRKFHQEIDQSLKEIDSRILSITAPTGLGKTLANIKVALSMARRNSVIVYALPFISIIDQTTDLMYKILDEVNHDATVLLPYHHLADQPFRGKEYEQPSIQRVIVENWHTQMVVTTFVSLFESLFTNRRIPFFYKLLNSVIILDEVQSIPHKYWDPISRILTELTEFGSTVILSTATRPALLKNAKGLVKGVYSADLNRTKIHFHGEIEYEEFFNVVTREVGESVKSGKKLLIVLNTIKHSKEIFERVLKESGLENLFYLSSNVIPKQRLERLKIMKEFVHGPLICVSTQVIEAGVDISFDKVIRDYAPLDSIIQAAGRCNRTFEKPIGDVDVYTVIGPKGSRSLASYVYDSFLLKITEEVVSDKQTYEEKEFSELVQRYFRAIENRGNTDKENLMGSFKSLKFEEVATFQLIEDKSETVPIYIEYDDHAVQLREQFNSFLRNSTLGKFEKLASIKKLLQKMSLYTIEVRANREELTGALIVENGFVVITKDNLSYWYNDLTGFQRREETMIV